MASFLKWLWFGSERSNAERGGRILAKRIAGQLEVCPVCKRDFDGHRLAPIGVTILTAENEFRINELRNVLHRGKWEHLQEFGETDLTKDLLFVSVIYCTAQAAAWVVTREPYELEDRAAIEEFQALGPADSRELLAQVSENQWIDM